MSINLFDDDAYERISRAVRYVEGLIAGSVEEQAPHALGLQGTLVVIKEALDPVTKMHKGRQIFRISPASSPDYYDSQGNTTTTTTTNPPTTPPPLWYEGDECWVVPMNGGSLTVGQRCRGDVVEFWEDGLPIVVTDCETKPTTAPPLATTTTTTQPPCGGKYCVFDFVDTIWEKVSDNCEDGCKCSAPGWCPDPADDGCTRVITPCREQDCEDIPVDCHGVNGNPGWGSTTTVPPNPLCTTTTLPPECQGGCDWFNIPFYGFVKVKDTCGSGCPCPTPSSSAVCDFIHTNCVPSGGEPVTPVCGGTEAYVCVTYPGGQTAWRKVDGSCSAVTDPVSGQICQSDAPASAPNPGCCGVFQNMPCYWHSGISNNGLPCECRTVTTTTLPPDPCLGKCVHRTTDGENWYVYSDCGDCDCVGPDRDPENLCDTIETACVGSTSTPPSTTTTPPPDANTYCWGCRRIDTNTIDRVCATANPTDNVTYSECSASAGPFTASTCANSCAFWCWSCYTTNPANPYNYLTCAATDPSGQLLDNGYEVYGCGKIFGPFDVLTCGQTCSNNTLYPYRCWNCWDNPLMTGPVTGRICRRENDDPSQSDGGPYDTCQANFDNAYGGSNCSGACSSVYTTSTTTTSTSTTVPPLDDI